MFTEGLKWTDVLLSGIGRRDEHYDVAPQYSHLALADQADGWVVIEPTQSVFLQPIPLSIGVLILYRILTLK
jgi:hypothetical protein